MLFFFSSAISMNDISPSIAFQEDNHGGGVQICGKVLEYHAQSHGSDSPAAKTNKWKLNKQISRSLMYTYFFFSSMRTCCTDFPVSDYEYNFGCIVLVHNDSIISAFKFFKKVNACRFSLKHTWVYNHISG